MSHLQTYYHFILDFQKVDHSVDLATPQYIGFSDGAHV